MKSLKLLLVIILFASCKKDEDVKAMHFAATPTATSSNYEIKVFSPNSDVDNVSVYLHLLTDSTSMVYTDASTPTMFNSSSLNTSNMTVYDVNTTGLDYTFTHDDYKGFTFVCVKDAYQLNGYSVKIQIFKNGVQLGTTRTLTDSTGSLNFTWRHGILTVN